MGERMAEKKSAGRRRTERSAGVILFRDTEAGRRFLLLDYGRYWDYPKGHVEKGEDDRAAALRELAEETGITDATILEGFEHEIAYFFRHPARGLVRKTVVFFLARTADEAVKLSHEHVGYEWASEQEAMKKLGFKTAKEVLSAAVTFLGQK
jgi:8-oxo-dGTP pyrophosphatase MutT (NUDIX family)